MKRILLGFGKLSMRDERKTACSQGKSCFNQGREKQEFFVKR